MRNSGPDFGFALGDQPALDELASTDLLLDALAEREDVGLDDPHDLHDQALAALLGEWRDDLRWPPASALVSQEEAVKALRTGVAERQRTRRGLAAIGSVAATLLLLSGFGAVVADARPGDLLYGLHAMLFDDSRVSDDQIVLSAKAELAKVQQMIDQGQWDQAQTQLAEVSSTVQAVNDGGRRQDLINEVNQLNTKVEKRDPNATLPPSDSPGNSGTPPARETESPAPPALSQTPLPAGAPESTAPSSPVVSATPNSPTSTPPPVASSPSTTSPAPSLSLSPPTSAQVTTPMPSAVTPTITPTSPPTAAPSRGPLPGPAPAPTPGSPLEPAQEPAPEPADASTSPPVPEAHASDQDASETPTTASVAPRAGLPGLPWLRLPRLGLQ